MNENMTNEMVEVTEVCEEEKDNGLGVGSVVLIAGGTYLAMNMLGKGAKKLIGWGAKKFKNAFRKPKEDDCVVVDDDEVEEA